MGQWNTVASDDQVEKTVAALEENGFKVVVVKTKEEAKEKVLDIIPGGSEVMTMTSVTLDTIGLDSELNSPQGKYKPVRDQMYSMDRATKSQEMNRLGSAPEYAVGSVHAITSDGKVLIASNTGSQLPAYAYGAQKVVWVVGTQKLVENVDAGMKRIYDYTLPLESERAKKAYGVDGSFVSKLLIVNKEINPGRITIVLVKEDLGY